MGKWSAHTQRKLEVLLLVPFQQLQNYYYFKLIVFTMQTSKLKDFLCCCLYLNKIWNQKWFSCVKFIDHQYFTTCGSKWFSIFLTFIISKPNDSSARFLVHLDILNVSSSWAFSVLKEQFEEFFGNIWLQSSYQDCICFNFLSVLHSPSLCIFLCISHLFHWGTTHKQILAFELMVPMFQNVFNNYQYRVTAW